MKKNKNTLKDLHYEEDENNNNDAGDDTHHTEC